MQNSDFVLVRWNALPHSVIRDRYMVTVRGQSRPDIGPIDRNRGDLILVDVLNTLVFFGF